LTAWRTHHPSLGRRTSSRTVFVRVSRFRIWVGLQSVAPVFWFNRCQRASSERLLGGPNGIRTRVSGRRTPAGWTATSCGPGLFDWRTLRQCHSSQTRCASTHVSHLTHGHVRTTPDGAGRCAHEFFGLLRVCIARLPSLAVPWSGYGSRVIVAFRTWAKGSGAATLPYTEVGHRPSPSGATVRCSSLLRTFTDMPGSSPRLVSGLPRHRCGAPRAGRGTLGYQFALGRHPCLAGATLFSRVWRRLRFTFPGATRFLSE
jgi:hypothetical protein